MATITVSVQQRLKDDLVLHFSISEKSQAQLCHDVTVGFEKVGTLLTAGARCGIARPRC